MAAGFGYGGVAFEVVEVEDASYVLLLASIRTTMTRNDWILLVFFVGTLIAIVVVSVAPVSDDATLTMRLWALSGSPIVIATISTAIAAFAGTWGAQALAERTARRRELLSEIRATNIALGSVFNIANAYIVAKRQHVSAIIGNHETQLEYHSNGSFTDLSDVELDLRTIYVPSPPLDDLNKLLREEINVGTKSIILFTQLSQSARDFAHTISERNRWIDEVRRMPNEYGGRARKARMFLGCPDNIDHFTTEEPIDTRYKDYVAALKLQIDDCIAFSIMLSQTLTEYGQKISRDYGYGSPQIHELQFSALEEYLPDMTAYQSWANMSL